MVRRLAVTAMLLPAMAACNGEDKPTGPPTILLSETSLEFGVVPLGLSEARTLTISNTGADTLEVFSVSLDSGDEDVWSWERTGDSNAIEPGGSVELTVTFTPDDEGVEEGSLQIRSSDETNSPSYIELSAEGAPSTLDNDGDGQSPADGDCNDDDATSYTGADEICDGRDNDCNGAVPANEVDADGDGYRLCDDDCDDDDGGVYPGAVEVCDDKDTDCDGTNADHADSDGDGYSICDDDCDDGEPLSYPTAAEVCDEVDNDCDGLVDNVDADGDGHSLCTEAGDCDDDSASAYPVVVDVNYSGTESGTDEQPFTTIEAGLAALDSTCRTVWIADGEYVDVSAAISDDVSIVGQSQDGVVITPVADSPAFVITGGTVVLQTLTVSGGNTIGDGGAIRSVDADVALVYAILESNNTSGDGGAIALTTGVLTLDHSILRGNVAADDGGAVVVLSGDLVDMGGTVIRDNSAVRGGGVLLESSSALLDGARIQGNIASDTGGGIAVVGGVDIVVERTRVWSNTAVNGGGGISITNLADAASVLRNNRFQNNDGGTRGGGVAVSGSAVAFEMANNTFTNNISTGEGAAIGAEATDQSGLSIIANIAGWNDGSSGIHAVASSGPTVGWNTVYATSLSVDFSGDAVEDDNGNVSRDPVFAGHTDNADPTDDDLTLGGSSPEVDSGPTDSSYDDTDGSVNDRGYTGGPGA
jgi:hypothetical protein